MVVKIILLFYLCATICTSDDFEAIAVKLIAEELYSEFIAYTVKPHLVAISIITPPRYSGHLK